MKTEICVPMAAVSLMGESGESTPPEVGDAVGGTFDGKVSRVEGDQVYLTVESVNGEAVVDGKPMGLAGPDSLPDGTTEDSLMTEAKGMPYA